MDSSSPESDFDGPDKTSKQARKHASRRLLDGSASMSSTMVWYSASDLSMYACCSLYELLGLASSGRIEEMIALNIVWRSSSACQCRSELNLSYLQLRSAVWRIRGAQAQDVDDAA